MPETETTTEAPGQIVGLIVMTVLAGVAAVVFAVIGAFTATSEFPTESEVAIKLGLSWWSNFALTVAVVSFVGTLVVTGVRKLFRNAGHRV